MKVGAIIRRFRAKRKISIHDLCAKTRGKVSIRTLKAIETNGEKSNPTIKTLLAIREAFGNKAHSIWMRHYLEDPVPLHRTDENPLKTAPFILTPTNKTLNRIVDVPDQKGYAVEIRQPVGVDFVKTGWVLFVSPSAEVRDGDLALQFMVDGGAHLYEEKSQYHLKHLTGAAKKRFLASRKKMRIEKVVMIKPK